MTAAVGADIESICSKCGDVWHVVVAKVGEKIAKVQCKQCGGFHRYKPPGGPPAKVAKSTEPRTRTSSGTGTRAPRRAAAEPPPPSVNPDLSRPVKRYAASEPFQVGDRVQHPTFGLGVVQSSPGPGKIDVAFPGGRRVLAQARPESTLGKPPSAS
jgi:hypothetical protein